MSQGTCVVCAHTITGRSDKRYCDRHQSYHRTACCICGKALWKPSRGVRRPVCSYACRWFTTWAGSCSEIPVAHPSRSSLLPPDHPARLPAPQWRFVAGTCLRCGQPFIGDRLACFAFGSYCSARCGKADGKDRRRARKRAAFVAAVNRRDIFERDHWRCLLCGKKVDPNRVVPHPRAPTIDHVIPLSRGGSHEPANVQTACFNCNARKSDGSLGAEQLRLVG